jgi:hypothetical protein
MAAGREGRRTLGGDNCGRSSSRKGAKDSVEGPGAGSGVVVLDPGAAIANSKAGASRREDFFFRLLSVPGLMLKKGKSR